MPPARDNVRRRPRPPLKEIPLERFLPAPNTDSPYSQARPNKRPHSPGGLSLYSPTKRRILSEEGVLSPEKKSPMSSTSGRFAPLYFDALLQGPGSPARKLDFSAAISEEDTTSPTSVVSTPRMTRSATAAARKVNSAKLAPSPELGKKNASRLKAAPLPAKAKSETKVSPKLRRAPSASILTVPREVTLPDRQSLHYPGFDVYQDRYIIIPSAASTPASDSDLSMDEGDEEKENVRPRKKKANSTPVEPVGAVWHKADLLSPSAKRMEMERVGMAVSVSATPKRLAVREKGDIISSARSTRLLEKSSLGNPSPNRTPAGNEARKMLRRAMEEEGDMQDDDEDMEL